MVHRRPARALLVAHIGLAVGWIGLTMCLLTLGIAGAAASSPMALRSAYQADGWLGLALVAPVSLGALSTGVAAALTGRWGLTRHWWVATKLGIAIALTIGSNFAIDLELQSASHVVTHTPAAILTASDIGTARLVAVGGPAGELYLLVCAVILSIYRPWGRIGGRRNHALIRGSRSMNKTDPESDVIVKIQSGAPVGEPGPQVIRPGHDQRSGLVDGLGPLAAGAAPGHH